MAELLTADEIAAMVEELPKLIQPGRQWERIVATLEAQAAENERLSGMVKELAEMVRAGAATVQDQTRWIKALTKELGHRPTLDAPLGN
jgi:diphthamide synthase (EF-2-diphthine--ammonia ligase)